MSCSASWFYVHRLCYQGSVFSFPIITMTAHIGFHPSLLADESPTFYVFFFIIYFILLFISQLFHHLDHVNCPFFFSTTSFLRCGDQNDSPQSRCKHINVLSGKLSLSFLFPVAYMIMKFCWVVLFLFSFFFLLLLHAKEMISDNSEPKICFMS